MRHRLFNTALVMAISVLANPLTTKTEIGVDDIKILNYALTLEHLENAFYKQGLANYTKQDFTVTSQSNDAYQDRGHFYDNLCEIAFDEQSHVDFLSKALGEKAVAPCTYCFPSTDPASFVALASVLEGAGVSAYLGAASAIVNKDYLTYAGSILTVEARHNAYIRAVSKQLPFAQPFDTPLGFNEVYSLAASFITSCPTENDKKPQITFKPFPTLSLSTAGQIKSGDTIVFSTPGYILTPPPGQSLYAAFMEVTAPIFVKATKLVDSPTGSEFNVVVPDGVNGQSYVVFNSCMDYVGDDVVIAGPAVVEVTNKDTYGLFHT